MIARPSQGVLPLPRLTKHMLSNGNWAGLLPLVIRRLTAMEIMFLSWHRTCRRRQFCGDWQGGNPGMEAVQGNVIIVPCASGADRALRWDGEVPHIRQRVGKSERQMFGAGAEEMWEICQVVDRGFL